MKGFPQISLSPWERVGVRAFTLIEILAAMAVLVILVLGLSRAFNDAAGAFRRGTIMVERNGAVQVAMEQLARDLNGMIINERVACYQEANTVDTVNGFGFDEIWFATSASDQDTGSNADPSAYHFVRYYVQVMTNSYLGMSYRWFRLNRTTWKTQLLRQNNIDPMGANREWWSVIGGTGEETETVLDNVIRFDLYVHDKNGDGLLRRDGNIDYFVSTQNRLAYVSNTIPAAIDVYLQATSQETMRQSGRILITSPANVNLLRQARSQMIRDSNMLTLRVFPFTAPGSWTHPAQFYY